MLLGLFLCLLFGKFYVNNYHGGVVASCSLFCCWFVWMHPIVVTHIVYGCFQQSTTILWVQYVILLIFNALSCWARSKYMSLYVVLLIFFHLICWFSWDDHEFPIWTELSYYMLAIVVEFFFVYGDRLLLPLVLYVYGGCFLCVGCLDYFPNTNCR